MSDVDTAYDHYAKIMQSAIEGSIDCVPAADPEPDTFETYARVLGERASTGAPLNQDLFGRLLATLEERRYR